MKISPINNLYPSKANICNCRNNKISWSTYPSCQEPSFRGVKGALKGFGIFGSAGALLGAVYSIGTDLLLPIALFFGFSAGIFGASLGHEDEERNKPPVK